MQVDHYLERIGVDPTTVVDPDHETLDRIQRAHVTSVPFETVAITGLPWGDHDRTGVTLEPAALYEKIVEARRGGFCYELNGLFNRLLRELGFEVTQLAGAVVTDGAPRPPANHLTSLVELDRRYVADVGLGVPPMRRPLPVDGTVRRDAAGVTWRAVESPRPDADFVTQYRVDDEEWTDRYVFRTQPRDLSYVRATCEYLTAAPESPFTGEPVVTMGLEGGYAKLTTDTYTRYVGGDEQEQAVSPEEWSAIAETTFGLRLPAP